ncbi:3-keto-5-aminohexanoate cleavage protein [Sinorhizobium sp. 7-81]|uniref:3-keto-5-aminohexanoate cleavage protein n=1 Tax=Sinorhizobium sp. 8-89 TaxID=3049089 RepID=UPI0024C2367A|nr:3-keto-5-aminohexanoate cleavage protein [Sinorhizobium sp. 8-89]MDK1494583.1 3-keto-5-aminohexanoate cleavage protein [Sinorhizobium sp. 8-89]
MIKTSTQDLLDEAAALYQRGCRYYHLHARNPRTNEQTTQNDVYSSVSRGIQQRCPSMLLSFGASRNGCEVQGAVQQKGEWERVSQCSLSLKDGGAHFVTIQAAVELQIICDLERRGFALNEETIDSKEFQRIIHQHRPSTDAVDINLSTHSTAKGANYGKTSASIQFENYRKAILTRDDVGLFHEVEWVQLERSYAMTRYAIEHPALGLGRSGQLNIILLFGFSPRLPFPATYRDFKRVVRLAKSLEYNLGNPQKKLRHVSVTVGAAVLPRQAAEHFKQPDVGRYQADRKCALRRLAIYASQPDSEVDVLRYGLEDTPYTLDGQGRVQLCDNQTLHDVVEQEIISQNVAVITEARHVLDRVGPARSHIPSMHHHIGYRPDMHDPYLDLSKFHVAAVERHV